jgi:glycosyltransferase involved in cell wall biosynthesis
VTYVARGADPFRGFAQFVAALSILQARNPNIEAMIVGDQTVYYGPGGGGDQYFQKVMATAEIDPARTHFTGRLPYDDYRKVLQISAAHVYLTVPFVLSWSALEALATGCLFIGSDTAPVREFVTHGENGLLADFFDSEALASLIEEAVKGGQRFDRMRTMARQTIRDRWEAEDAIRQHESLVERLLNGDQRL